MTSVVTDILAEYISVKTDTHLSPRLANRMLPKRKLWLVLEMCHDSLCFAVVHYGICSSAYKIAGEISLKLSPDSITFKYSKVGCFSL